jgi:hypothetical protein
LNDFTDGGCIKDIICPCLSFVVLITTDGGLVSIYTYPNVKTVEGLQSDIIAVKEYASDLQTFLGSKAIEKEVKKEEESLMALSEDGCVQQIDLRYNEQVITLYNVPSSLRITSLLLDLSTNIILPFGQTMHPLISMLYFPFGILNVVCKVSLISRK